MDSPCAKFNTFRAISPIGTVVFVEGEGFAIREKFVTAQARPLSNVIMQRNEAMQEKHASAFE